MPGQRAPASQALATPGPEDDAKATGLVRLAPFASPALASGGTGDVLTGIIGGLLARAGLRWRLPAAGSSCTVGPRQRAGLVASDLPDCLPRAMSLLRPDG